jgi:hypothetical protein
VRSTVPVGGGRSPLSFDEKRIAHWSATGYSFSMTGPEIKALPIEQKMQIMEAIWEDFRDRFEQWDIPEEQRTLLDQRRARVREGAAQLYDWDSVKGSIGRP